jgi:imidazolonepropionase
LSVQRIKADLVIRNIGQLVTISGHTNRPCVRPTESDLGIIGTREHSPPDICVASRRGVICFVGKISQMGNFVDTGSAVELDARGGLVLPGFVDPHTHCVFAGSRETELNDKLAGLTYLEILAKGGGIMKTVRETHAAGDSEILDQTRTRLQRMLFLGTTTVEIKTGYGLNVQDEIRLLQIIDELRKSGKFDITSTLLSAHAIPPEYFKNVEGYIENVVKPSIDCTAEKKLASYCDVFMEQGIFGRDEAKSILQYARSKGLDLKIHADEFTDMGGSNLAAELKVRSADHLMNASMEGIKALSKAGVMAVLLPGTSLSSFSSSYANARQMITDGCPIALGTDLSPNSWIESMQFVISLACYKLRMTAAEALVASTINAAHAIGRAQDVGSIEVGKKCDVLLANLKNYLEMPYRIASNTIDTVIKSGEVVEIRVNHS